MEENCNNNKADLLIKKCLQNNRSAQFELYEMYSRKVFGVCMRYAKNHTDAEDILQEGFIKVFKYLKDFSGKGSLEAWMRRIMVTTALNYYKKKNLLNKEVDPENSSIGINEDYEVVASMSHSELLNLIRELPVGYQTVFNLNTIEGYSHKEISQMMKISVNTSKSQLSRAKMALRKRLTSIFEEENTLISMAAYAS